MIFPDLVLGRSSAQMIRPGRASLPIWRPTCSRSVRLQVGLACDAGAQGDVGHHRLAGQVVGGRDDRGLGDRGVRDEGRFDLGGGQPVAGHVDHVVDPPGDPEIAVLVAPCAVAGEIGARAEPAEIGLHVPVGVVVQSAEHARPRPGQHEQAAALPDLGTRLVHQGGRDARQREAGRSRLRSDQAGQGGDHDGAGLRLPPRVHDGATLAADDRVVPQPGLGVDRLADRAEQPQRRQVVLGRVVLPPLHARPDGGRRGVDNRHAVPLDDRPPDVLVRVVRGTLEHHRRAAVGQRAVDDVRMTGDPAHVGRAPEDVALRIQVEDHRGGGGDRGEISARGVQDSLGFGGRAGRVEQEQRVLCLHRLRRADRVGAGDQVVEPHVPSGSHDAIGAGGPDHHHRLQVG